ncbi:MAG: hypothetical protein HY749_15970 [Gammaproteobacteria bacterium]|nr:hypothetical protein [Gammaproteobacteria bacterium]
MKAELIWALVLALIVVIFVSLIGVSWRNCHEHGGAFVRGVIWFECIEKQCSQ